MIAPPPIPPLSPSDFTPGAPPFRPFPGGPWFRVTMGGTLEIFASGTWTSTPQSLPNTTLPTTPPARFGPPPSAIGPSLLGIEAAYNSFSRLYAAALAVYAAGVEAERIAEEGDQLSGMLARAEDWVKWLANHPLGQQMAAVTACIANNIAAIQGEIDRLLTIPVASRSWPDYFQLAALQMALSNMERNIEYVRQLRSDFIRYGGELPNYDQVNSLSCTPIPLEPAPYPTPVMDVPPQAIVPNSPPVGDGPLFPGVATLPANPPYVDND